MTTIPYVEHFYSREDADKMFEFLLSQPHVRNTSVKSGGKIPLRRVNYPSYSIEPNAYNQRFPKGNPLYRDFSVTPPEMFDLAARLSAYSGKEINYLSCIGYENERDHINRHSHREDYGQNDMSVYVVSYGAPRELLYGPRDPNAKKKFTFLGEPESLIVGHGSLYVLPHQMNIDGLHEIPDADHPCGLRIAVNCKTLQPRRILHVNDAPFDPATDVYIGRTFHDRSTGVQYEASPFANYFADDRKGYEIFIRHTDLIHQIEGLRGKRLRCFCRFENALKCHGNVLLKLLDEVIQ